MRLFVLRMHFVCRLRVDLYRDASKGGQHVSPLGFQYD